MKTTKTTHGGGRGASSGDRAWSAAPCVCGNAAPRPAKLPEFDKHHTPHDLPFKKDWLGYAAVIASLIVAFAIWIGYMAADHALYDNWQIYLAKIGSHGSVMLMSWAILLATRLSPFENLFMGLDKLYKAHRRIGVWSFLIIFLHPVFLAIAWNDSLPDILRFFWFSDNVVRNTGIAALLGFILLVVLTVAVKMAYHNWKRSHDFFGLLLLLVAVHLILAEGEIMQYTWLRIWYFSWIGAALLGYIYIRLLYRCTNTRLHE